MVAPSGAHSGVVPRRSIAAATASASNGPSTTPVRQLPATPHRHRLPCRQRRFNGVGAGDQEVDQYESARLSTARYEYRYTGDIMRGYSSRSRPQQISPLSFDKD